MTKLDVTEWSGKQVKLRKLISKECKLMSQNDNLPNVLIMTTNQYEILKKCEEFGNKDEVKLYKPQDRIYTTPYNAMEVEIKD